MNLEKDSFFNPMKKNFQGRFLILSLLVILLECLFLIFTIKDNLNRPTIQDIAKVGLVKFAMAKTIEKREAVFKKYLKSRIYLWPKDGISLSEKGSISSKIDYVLARDWGDEYKNLVLEEKKIIKEKTLPFIEKTITEKGEDFDKNKFEGSFEEELFISNASVGLTRYKWDGFKKNMLFFLFNNKLYFSSISDVADKMSFLISILLPLTLLIISSFLLVYFNYFFNMKRQNTINKQIKGLLNETQQKNFELDLQKKNLKNLLENLGQGFMIFDKEGIIQEGATLASKNIFQCEPEGQNIGEVLRLSEEDKVTFEKWRKNVWKGLLAFKDIVDLAPKNFNEIKGQIIQLEYRAIYEGKKVDKVICVASDTTKETELLEKIERDREDVQFIKSCLSRPLEFIDLMNDTTEIFSDFPYEGNLESHKEEIFRIFHTLKARYGQFGQKYLTFHINSVETAISKSLWEGFSEKLKDLNLVLNEFFKKHRSVIEAANRLIIEEVQTIDALELNHKMYEVESLEELKSFVLENYILKDFKSLFYRYERVLEELAEEQGKNIQFEITGERILVDPKDFMAFINISLHLFRNIVDHGVETPEERIEKVKPEVATVRMNFIKESNRVKITLEDDGKGIDPKRIKEKVIEVGIKKEEDLKNFDDNSLVNLIFLPGFSTKKNVTDISGRGVGMDAVKAKIEELEGTIKLVSEVDKGTKYIIEIPLLKKGT